MRRVPPGENGRAFSNGDPGTNGASLKTRSGAWNEHEITQFASVRHVRLKLRRIRISTEPRIEEEIACIVNSDLSKIWVLRIEQIRAL